MQNKRSVAILCGGQSSRMGQDKAGLWWRGETFLTHLEETLASVGTLYLSMGADRTYKGTRGITVVDRHAHCGPLGGLHAVLERCETEQLFVTTVDQPRTDRVLAEEILSFLVDPVDAVVPVDVKGRMHPLCAAYRKSILPLVEEQIENGQYRVQDLLDRLRVCYVPVGKLTDGATKLDNINTPEDYRRLLNSQAETVYERVDSVGCLREEIPVFSVVAYSGSGKTTFLEKLIAELKMRGLSIKPGMPTMAASFKERTILCLSGNPYSAIAMFEILYPAYEKKAQGRNRMRQGRSRGVMENTFPKSSSSRRLVRGIRKGNDVFVPEMQGNGQLLAGVGSNCLVDIPAGSGPVMQGDEVGLFVLPGMIMMNTYDRGREL